MCCVLRIVCKFIKNMKSQLHDEQFCLKQLHFCLIRLSESLFRKKYTHNILKSDKIEEVWVVSEATVGKNTSDKYVCPMSITCFSLWSWIWLLHHCLGWSRNLLPPRSSVPADLKAASVLTGLQMFQCGLGTTAKSPGRGRCGVQDKCAHTQIHTPTHTQSSFSQSLAMNTETYVWNWFSWNLVNIGNHSWWKWGLASHLFIKFRLFCNIIIKIGLVGHVPTTKLYGSAVIRYFKYWRHTKLTMCYFISQYSECLRHWGSGYSCK